MAVYQFRLFGQNGKIVAVQRFSAESDREAVSFARGSHGLAFKRSLRALGPAIWMQPLAR